jgi:hypothetical protein
MKTQITRKATVDNINRFLKKAQEEEETDLGDIEPEDDVAESAEGEEGDEVVEEPPEEDEPTSLEERVDELEENQEVLTEGLEEQKEVIENIMEVEEGEGHTFEDFLDETDEDATDEISTEELGLGGEDFLTAAEEGSMSLRDQRKARLMGKNAAEKTETVADQWNLEKDRKKRSGPIQPETPQGKVPEHKMPDIFKVGDLSLELTDDKKAWLVLDKNDKPLCTIKQGSEKPETFASPEFAKAVILDMHKMGIRQALKKHKAEKLPAKVADTTEKPVEKTAAATDQTAINAANGDYKRRFVRALRLALTAMNKNLAKPIPLKAAFMDILTSLNISQPEKIIEAAFAKAGIKHFETALAHTEKYMGMKDEAFIELEANINDVETAEVVAAQDDDVEEAIHEHAADLRRRARSNSMPFSSSSEEDLTDRMAALDRVLPKPKLISLKGVTF